MLDEIATSTDQLADHSPPHHARGPVHPSPAATVALRPMPLSNVHVTGGMWQRWQRANAHESVRHQVDWLEHDGTIDNLRRLAPDADPTLERRGLWFTDSDLYKLVEGLAWLRAGDAAPFGHDDKLDELVSIISAAQEDDGYLNSWIQAGSGTRWAELEQSHELYCIGHLIQAAIALTRTSSDPRLMTVAIRAADLIWDTFGEGRRQDLDGHEEIEMALVELARETGEQRYLTLARQFVDGRGHGRIPNWFAGSAYLQDDVPVREQDEAVGHAVRGVYLLCGAADVAIETDDQPLLAAVTRQWETMTSRKMYVTGALGSRFDGEAFGEDWELQTDRSYGETCASIGYLMLSWRLLLESGEGRFADAIEHTLYNLFAASTSVDRVAYFYNNPIQRRRSLPEADPHRRSPRAEAEGTRPPWFECACCPPNILRTVASLTGYIATTDSAGVQLHQYMPATIDDTVSAESVRLTVDTAYPLDGAIRITVEETPSSPWTLSLRIPAWAETWHIRVNGTASAAPLEHGYARLQRVWQPGDTVDLELPLRPVFLEPHPAADGLRGTVALRRGPVVYALESVDQEPDVDLQLVSVDPSITPTAHADALAGEPYVALTTDGLVASPSSWEQVGYRALPAPPAPTRTTTLRFIPYHLWANRGASTMRVHVPTHRSDGLERRR
ncbi:glycoside hydrolase family 127 protein [Curtobacterium ammoniigenes]|uniref:glycoside hydrolase family 127 protein n=1 Tax=Curtobacterium ammoniigenes TaxID=395387 RepID=UPI00082BE1D8|nr:beta-L-arabinofuranosidase domain-containing protein [Curtobacterium ammoniigenes]